MAAVRDNTSVAEIEDYAFKDSSHLEIGTILDCKTSSDLENKFYLTPNGIVRVNTDGKTSVLEGRMISFDCTDTTVFAITIENEVRTAAIRPASPDIDSSSLPRSKQVVCGAKDALLLTIDSKIHCIPGDQNAPHDLECFPSGRPLFIAAGDDHMVAILEDSKGIVEAPVACPRNVDMLHPHPSISSVMADKQLSDVTGRLLAFKRLSAARLHSPLGGNSVDETGHYDMQEITTVLYKWGNQRNCIKLDIPHVIFVSCGKEHSAFTSAFGELFLLGKPFHYDEPAFDKPMAVKCPNAFVLKAVAGEYVTVVMLLSMEPNQQGQGPVVGVVKDDFTLQFCSLSDGNVPLEVSCSRRCKTGTVMFRAEHDRIQMANIFDFCKRYGEALQTIGLQAINNCETNPQNETHAMLFQTMKQLIRSMVTLVRYMSLNIFLSHSDTVGHRFLSLLRNHICDVEKFWHQLHLVCTHQDVRKSLEQTIKLKAKAPKMEQLESLLPHLHGILEDGMLRAIEDEAKSAHLRMNDSEIQSKDWKGVVKDKQLLEFLCSLGEKLKMSTLDNNNEKDFSAPLKIKGEERRFGDLKPFLPERQEKEGKSKRGIFLNYPKILCLTENHLVFVAHGVITAWNLSAVWIFCENPDSIVVTTPDMNLTLSQKSADDGSVKKWLGQLIPAISETFVKTLGVSPTLQSLKDFSERKMKYDFQTGFLKGFHYDGEWKDGDFHGHGHLTACGMTTCEYEGEFCRGLPFGFGTFARFGKFSSPRYFIDRIYAGRWKDKLLDGFGMTISHEYETMEVNGKKSTLFEIFCGQFCDGNPVGRGFRTKEGQASSIEDVCEPSSGIVKHITSIDHRQKMVDYTVTSDSRRYGELCDDNKRYWYKGILNERNEPAGWGTLFWNYSTSYPVKIEGYVWKVDGRLKVDGLPSNDVEMSRRSNIILRSNLEGDDQTTDHWKHLVRDCRSAFIAGLPEQANEVQMGKEVWERKLKPLLKSDDDGMTKPAANDAEIEEWESAMEGRIHSLEKWEAMKNLTYRLLTIPKFPVSILIDVRQKVIELPVGFNAMEGAKIYQLVKQDMNQLLRDMYCLIRIFLPILPQQISIAIDCNSENRVYGRDFCSSMLPESLRTSFLKILHQESETADNYRRRGSEKSDNYVIDSLNITNKNLLNALKNMVEQPPQCQPQHDPLHTSSSYPQTFNNCVAELKAYLHNKDSCICDREPVKNFDLLQHLEIVNTNLNEFLRNVDKDIEKPDADKARGYLFWKAKLKSVTFIIEFLKFFMQHRISDAQQKLLEEIQEAYWLSLSVGFR